jgi:hypothetical protein
VKIHDWSVRLVRVRRPIHILLKTLLTGPSLNAAMATAGDQQVFVGENIAFHRLVQLFLAPILVLNIANEPWHVIRPMY